MAEHDGFVVGVHVKSLRASMDPLPVIERIVGDAGPDCPGARLRVDAHTDVMTPGGRPPRTGSRTRLRSSWPPRAASTCTCTTTSPTTSSGTTCQSLDVSVLPYRFGTHSGWLEACYDLGTTCSRPTAATTPSSGRA